jgi:hypothetical protein
MPPEQWKGRKLHPNEAAAQSVHLDSLATVTTEHRTRSPNSQERLVAAFAKLDRAADRRARKRRRTTAGYTLASQRLAEIERFLSWRYGHVLADDDAGHDDLSVLLSAAKAAGHPAMPYAQKWAPWLCCNDARRACLSADLRDAYAKADPLADRIGLTYAVRQLLHLRTIGSIDVRKPERERLRRQRAKDKVQAAKPAKPLTDREKTIVRMVGTGINMGDLSRRAKRSPLFRHLENVPLEVRRIVGRLVKSGHLGQRLEPRDRGGREYYLWPQERNAQETPVPQSLHENAPRQTPIFIGSNRGAVSCVNTPEGGNAQHDLDGVNFGIPVGHGRDRAGPRSCCGPALRSTETRTRI